MAELLIDKPRAEGSHVLLAARFKSAAGEHRLWYRVEAERHEDLARNADPFVLATIHLAMKIGESVKVQDTVSPSLLRNLEDVQRAWSTWKPRHYRQVDVSATEEREPDLPTLRTAISSFSGGVDSCFTAFRHSRGITTRFPMPLRASVMVHGFDIPLDDDDGYQHAASSSERQLKTLDLELFRVATNFRELPVDWVDAFGAAVASTLSLFHGGFETGLIASGIPFGAYRSLVEGENPITNHLLSSSSFKIVGDGAGFQRIEKIPVLAQWKDGVDDLRVCARNRIRYENCGVCEKCIRNVLSYRALGLSLPASLLDNVSDQQILDLAPLKEMKIDIGYAPILKVVADRGLENESWVRAVKKTVSLSRLCMVLRKFRGGMRVWRLIRRLSLLK